MTELNVFIKLLYVDNAVSMLLEYVLYLKYLRRTRNGMVQHTLPLGLLFLAPSLLRFTTLKSATRGGEIAPGVATPWISVWQDLREVLIP